MHATRYSSLSVVCNDWVYDVCAARYSILGHQSKSSRLGLYSFPGTMGSGYVQYAEGLHFSAFHFY